MFYVIKDNILYEYGDRISAGWNCPQEAKELSGVTMADFIADREKYAVENGCLVDISSTETYIASQQEKQKEARITEIKAELDVLDLKCIRAIREGGNDTDGVPYLEKFQQQINTLRAELNSLE